MYYKEHYYCSCSLGQTKAVFVVCWSLCSVSCELNRFDLHRCFGWSFVKLLVLTKPLVLWNYIPAHVCLVGI